MQDDGPRAYDHFPGLLEKFGLPVLCIPGNHDDRDAMQEKLSQAPFLYCGTLRAGNWEIVGIDSCLDGQAGGRIAEAELDRLSGLLEKGGADHVCVCLHHPPVAVHSRWLDSVGLENRDAFLERLEAAGNVRLVLFGHVHQAIDVRAGQIPIVGTPSTCRQFMPRADRFAVDDNPPAYRRVELNDDGTARSDLVWID